ncbi:hypothetical protein, partial [Staphylococcus aureus]|uniref:hypothetical protein n=1 Tax=Staphylococcus aureus TaxID=1280 RepID=UPI0038B3C2D1
TQGHAARSAQVIASGVALSAVQPFVLERRAFSFRHPWFCSKDLKTSQISGRADPRDKPEATYP